METSTHVSLLPCNSCGHQNELSSGEIECKKNCFDTLAFLSKDRFAKYGVACQETGKDICKKYSHKNKIEGEVESV